MDLNPVDGGKLLVLMIAGGLFALVGLWLLLRPKSEGQGAKIELFGLKFESASAGLLVFVIGAAFLALPLFLPPPDSHSTSPSGGEGNVETEGPKAGDQDLGDIVLPRRVSGSEAEPNDGISDSNQFTFGETVEGKLSPGDEDWWTFAVDDDVEQFRVTFRNLSEGCPQYSLFDHIETQLYDDQICSGEVSSTRLVWNEGGPFYLRAISNGYRTDYQVVTAIVE